MDINRRNFLTGLGASGALGFMGGCRMFSCPSGSASYGKANLKFGVLSDIHISSRIGNTIDGPSDVQFFRRALEWYRDQGVDAVMIAGDMADNGVCDQLMQVAAVWNEVFPGDRAPDGRKVEKLFVYGNHDWEGWRYGNYAKNVYADEKERERQILANDYAGNWERIFGEKYEPVYTKVVKGYTFIGAHWNADCCRGAREIGVADPGEVIAKVAPTIDPQRPFFYFQHPQPDASCYGGWGWGRDDGRSTRALSKYPNAIAFSGHSHYSLTDDRTFWQGAFTSVGTSSLRYTGMPDGYRKGGYENTGGAGKLDAEKVAADFGTTWFAQQGMMVEVYDDRVVFVRREFRHGNSLGDDIVLPLGAADRPLAYETRKAKEQPPRFPAKAMTKVVTYERNRRSGGKTKCWEVVVPPAIYEKSTRPLEYEAKIVKSDGSLFATKYLLAPGYNMPASDPSCCSPVCIPIATSQLPKGEFHFEVTPISALGTRGATLVSTAVCNTD